MTDAVVHQSTLASRIARVFWWATARLYGYRRPAPVLPVTIRPADPPTLASVFQEAQRGPSQREMWAHIPGQTTASLLTANVIDASVISVPPHGYLFSGGQQ